MSIKGLSQNKVVLSDNQLLNIGFKKESPVGMDQGYYIIHSITTPDSFIEIINEYNDDGKFFCQYMNMRVLRESVRDYTENEVKMLAKRFI